MIKRILALSTGVILLGSIAVLPGSAQALKKAKECDAEYKANKSAIQAVKEPKRDFIAACRALSPGTPTPIGAPSAQPPAPAPTAPPPGRAPAANGLKTAGACDDEYKSNKPAIRAAKVLKRDYIAACRALPVGTPTPIGASAAPAPAPQPTPTPTPTPTPQAPQASTPSPSPAPQPAPAPSPRSQAPTQPSAPGESACAGGYAKLAASHTTLQFCTDREAQSRCPRQPVVWVNTKSKIYHKAGSNTYGHTKEGAYMCETDAAAEGDRPSRNGH